MDECPYCHKKFRPRNPIDIPTCISNHVRSKRGMGCERHQGPRVIIRVANQYIDTNTDKDKDKDEKLLYRAAKNGDLQQLSELLVNHQIDVNRQFDDGYTPLMTACEAGHTNIVEKLLADSQVNINIANQYGQTALAFAALYRRQTVIHMLLEYNRQQIALEHDKISKAGSALLESLILPKVKNNLAEFSSSHSKYNLGLIGTYAVELRSAKYIPLNFDSVWKSRDLANNFQACVGGIIGDSMLLLNSHFLHIRQLREDFETQLDSQFTTFTSYRDRLTLYEDKMLTHNNMWDAFNTGIENIQNLSAKSLDMAITLRDQRIALERLVPVELERYRYTKFRGDCCVCLSEISHHETGYGCCAQTVMHDKCLLACFQYADLVEVGSETYPSPGIECPVHRHRFDFQNLGMQLVTFGFDIHVIYDTLHRRSNDFTIKKLETERSLAYQKGVAESALQSTVNLHFDVIQRTILTQCCPKCGLAYMLVEGCQAVKCRDDHGNGCGTYFCNVCWTTHSAVSSTVHDHVSSCVKKFSHGKMQATYFLSKSDAEQLAISVKNGRIEDYFNKHNLPDHIKSEIRHRIKPFC